METKLITALKKAITALENKTVYYDWKKHSMCNCGIVAQCVLGVGPEELEIKIKPLRSNTLSLKPKDKQNTTWKESIQLSCPTTGNNMYDIIKELENAGMTRADITHLEFMDNEAILKIANILKIPKFKEVLDTQVIKDEVINTKDFKLVNSTNPLKRLFGIKERVEIEVKTTNPRLIKTFKQEKEGDFYEKEYYTKEANLILYLKAWVKILDGSADRKICNDKEKLQADILIASSEERYEDCIIIQNELLNLS